MTYVRQPQGNVRARIVRKGNGDELEIAEVTSLKGPTGSRWAAKDEAQAKEESQAWTAGQGWEGHGFEPCR
jgi:hypothetical protein